MYPIAQRMATEVRLGSMRPPALYTDAGPNLERLGHVSGPSHALQPSWRALAKPARSAPIEPHVMHFLQKPLGDAEAGVVAKSTVNPTKRTEGRLLRVRHTIVSPVRDLIRVKNCLTIKATALLAPFNFCTVINALFVSNTERMSFRQIERTCHIDRLPSEGGCRVCASSRA